MAELLVKAIDATHRDPGVDRTMFKAGDIVCVRPDGWQWGTDEAKSPADGGKFFIVHVPDAVASDLVHLESPASDGRARRYHVPVNEVANIASRDGVVTMSRANVARLSVSDKPPVLTRASLNDVLTDKEA